MKSILGPAAPPGATVLLSAAAALTMTLRHRSAELRHLVSSVALTGALVLPFIGLLLPTLPVPMPQVLADGVSRVAPTRIAAALEQSVPSSPALGSSVPRAGAVSFC